MTAISRPAAAFVLTLALGAAAAGCATATLHTLARSGELPVRLEVAWRRLVAEPKLVEYKPQEFAQAETDGRRVFVGSSDGTFWALARDNGAVVWRKTIASVSSRPLYLASLRTLFVGGDDGALRALDPDTGAEKWIYRTKGPIGGAPIYDDGAIYFVNGESRVYCVDALTGKWRWQYERETPETFTIRGVASPLLHNGRVYAGFADGYLAALSARTGDVLWARSLAGDAQRFMDVDSTPVVVDGVLYVADYASGVYALDPADGSVKWRYEVEGAGTVRVDRGRVYFAAARAGLHCLDLAGHVLWKQALAAEGELSAPIVLAGRFVLVSAALSGTYLVDAASGELLQFFEPGHGVTAEPSTDGALVYVLTNTGFLYAFRVVGATT